MRKLLVLLEGGLLLIGLALAGMGWLQHKALEQPVAVGQEQLVEIPKGATPGGMLRHLEEEKLLSGSFWLRLYWRFNLSGQALHSGEYRVTPGMRFVNYLPSGKKARWSNTTLRSLKAGTSIRFGMPWLVRKSWSKHWLD